VVAGTQPLWALHDLPAAQHCRFAPLPHGVLPAGHPQMPRALSRHGTPFLQHDVPHGVSPLQQQVTVAGSEQVSVFLQQPSPQ
jgi:hypothetical protein